MTDIDIFDANLKPIGTMNRRHAHNLGMWHKSFHCWVYATGGQPSLLFQLRAPDSTNFPDMLDVSAAGHLNPGESPEDGIRELHEELGIMEVTAQDLIFAGSRVEVADQSNGQLNREYQFVYFMETPYELERFSPEPKEVWGLYWVPIEPGISLFVHERDSVLASGIAWNDARSQYVADERTFGRDDFLPRIQRYYLAALLASQRLIDGDRLVAIS